MASNVNQHEPFSVQVLTAEHGRHLQKLIDSSNSEVERLSKRLHDLEQALNAHKGMDGAVKLQRLDDVEGTAASASRTANSLSQGSSEMANRVSAVSRRLRAVEGERESIKKEVADAKKIATDLKRQHDAEQMHPLNQDAPPGKKKTARGNGKGTVEHEDHEARKGKPPSADGPPEKGASAASWKEVGSQTASWALQEGSSDAEMIPSRAPGDADLPKAQQGGSGASAQASRDSLFVEASNPSHLEPQPVDAERNQGNIDDDHRPPASVYHLSDWEGKAPEHLEQEPPALTGVHEYSEPEFPQTENTTGRDAQATGASQEDASGSHLYLHSSEGKGASENATSFDNIDDRHRAQGEPLSSPSAPGTVGNFAGLGEQAGEFQRTMEAIWEDDHKAGSAGSSWPPGKAQTQEGAGVIDQDVQRHDLAREGGGSVPGIGASGNGGNMSFTRVQDTPEEARSPEGSLKTSSSTAEEAAFEGTEARSTMERNEGDVSSYHIQDHHPEEKTFSAVTHDVESRGKGIASLVEAPGQAAIGCEMEEKHYEMEYRLEEVESKLMNQPGGHREPIQNRIPRRATQWERRLIECEDSIAEIEQRIENMRDGNQQRGLEERARRAEDVSRWAGEMARKALEIARGGQSESSANVEDAAAVIVNHGESEEGALQVLRLPEPSGMSRDEVENIIEERLRAFANMLQERESDLEGADKHGSPHSAIARLKAEVASKARRGEVERLEQDLAALRRDVDVWAREAKEARGVADLAKGRAERSNEGAARAQEEAAKALKEARTRARRCEEAFEVEARRLWAETAGLADENRKAKAKLEELAGRAGHLEAEMEAKAGREEAWERAELASRNAR